MSDFKQTSFSGGLNLLLDDTRLPVSFKYKEGDTPYDISYNQYRIGLNMRSRFDVCTPVQSSITDLNAPSGIKQAIVTFGNYIIVFIAGSAYYRLNTQSGWNLIPNFSMSKTAVRYWTVAIPLSVTNYGRVATAPTGSTVGANANLPILQVNQLNLIAGEFANVPGLLVQDGINQPCFLYIDQNGVVTSRTTQTYAQWSFPLDHTTLQLTGPDNREYVPIGTYMEWFNGILFIVDANYNYIYRSVSGRPLDFVVNVDQFGNKGGDATTTSYSVGVSGITAMRLMSANSLFIAAGGSACFLITLNQTPNAPTIFGEYTFNRTLIFNASCVTERGIIDILGDTVFIDTNGLRSFNAVEQQQNEGRNSIFSSTIQSLFTNVQQQANLCAAVNFDNYAIFSVNTTLGYVLVVYDTINNCYSSLDTTQIGNHAVKQFATITISYLQLYCITDDDRVVQLYGSSTATDSPTIRLGAISTQEPKKEIQIVNVRAIMTNITQNITVTCSLFVNNRYESAYITKINYKAAIPAYSGTSVGTDVGTQTNNILFSFPNAGQGWKAFIVLSWTGGASLASVGIMTTDVTPMQPLLTQAVINNT